MGATRSSPVCALHEGEIHRGERVDKEREIRGVTGHRSHRRGFEEPETTVDRSAGVPAAGDTVVDLDLEEAWEHRDELTDICWRIVGDRALAEDVVQETYLQAMRNLDRLERRDGLMPWLVTVAKRRSLNELRRGKYSTPVEFVPERTMATPADPSESAVVTDELERVKAALDTLTDRERDLLLRQVFGSASLAELVEAEGSSPASVRSVLCRARAKLRVVIEEAGARALAPIALVTGWVRRQLPAAQTKLQPGPLTWPGAPERLNEWVIAGAMSIAVAFTGVVPPSPSAGASAVGGAPAGGAPDASALVSATGEPGEVVHDAIEVISSGGGEVAGAPAATPITGSSSPGGEGSDAPVAGDAVLPDPDTADDVLDRGTDEVTGSLPPAPDTGGEPDTSDADELTGGDDPAVPNQSPTPDADSFPDPDPPGTIDDDRGDRGESGDGEDGRGSSEIEGDVGDTLGSTGDVAAAK